MVQTQHAASLRRCVREPCSPAVSDVHDVAVLHDILFALEPQCATRARIRLGAGIEKLIPVDGFRPNEMFLEIRMDRARCSLRTGSTFDSPCAAFIFAYKIGRASCRE